jgi:hypothetical protein
MTEDAAALEIERAVAAILPAGQGFQAGDRVLAVYADVAQPCPGQASAAGNHGEVARRQLARLFDEQRFAQVAAVALLQESVGSPGAGCPRRDEQRLRIVEAERLTAPGAVFGRRPGEGDGGIAGEQLRALAVTGRRKIIGVEAFVERQVFARGVAGVPDVRQPATGEPAPVTGDVKRAHAPAGMRRVNAGRRDAPPVAAEMGDRYGDRGHQRAVGEVDFTERILEEQLLAMDRLDAPVQRFAFGSADGHQIASAQPFGAAGETQAAADLGAGGARLAQPQFVTGQEVEAGESAEQAIVARYRRRQMQRRRLPVDRRADHLVRLQAAVPLVFEQQGFAGPQLVEAAGEDEGRAAQP